MENNTEIDIIEVLIKLVKFIKKYFFFLIIFFVVGTVAGFVASKFAKPVYKTKMFATTGILKQIPDGNGFFITDSELLVESINFLNDANKSELLGIKSGKLLEISAEKKEDTDNFSVSLTLSDNEDFENISKKIKQYFEENEYLKNKLTLQSDLRKRLALKIDEEIKKIDSIKLASDNQIVVDASNSVNNETVFLYEKKLQLENLNKNPQVLNVVIDFYKPQPSNSKKLMVMLAMPIVFLLLAFFIAVVRELLKISK